jgi:hypothetical protein
MLFITHSEVRKTSDVCNLVNKAVRLKIRISVTETFSDIGVVAEA